MRTTAVSYASLEPTNHVLAPPLVKCVAAALMRAPQEVSSALRVLRGECHSQAQHSVLRVQRVRAAPGARPCACRAYRAALATSLELRSARLVQWAQSKWQPGPPAVVRVLILQEHPLEPLLQH